MDHSHITDFSWYTGNLTWLQNRTVVLSKSGSQSYGTNLPSSDLDLRGVAIAPMSYYLGFLNNFEQAEVKEPVDAVIYDIRKFFKLASDANPNILEQLYVDPTDIFLTTPLWSDVLAQRDLFLSRKVRHTFSGYAISQLRRIRTHRKWLLDPPKGQPRRADFGLPEGQVTLGKDQLGIIEARIRKIEDILSNKGLSKADLETPRLEQQLVTDAITDLNLAPNLIPLVLAERSFGGAVKTWSQYQTWKAERNVARQELEARYGYDTKHGMHLVRLLRMGAEILRGQGVIVKRPDAEELLTIRAGAWTFEVLEEYAVRLDKELGALEAASTLPHSPDRVGLNDLLVHIITASQ